MTMSLTPLLLAVFLFAVSLVIWGYLGFTESRFAEKKLIRQRLLYMSAGGMHGETKFSIYKEDAVKQAGILGKLLYRVPRIASLDRLLIRSKFPMNASAFVLLSLSLAVAGAVLGALLPFQGALGALLGCFLGLLPYLLLRRAEKKFVKAFEEQLPEALDFIIRAMRSGHAFTSAMETAGQELPEPVGPEFVATVDQIKFGLSPQEALQNLCERTAVGDLRFFSIAVVLHKEAGGNITEVFEKISHIIRQRLQFRRQVKALTAEGRFSAIVLVVLPILMFAYVYVVNFNYVSLLWTDEAGQYMFGFGLAAMVFGYAIMNKMAKLDM